MVDVFGSPSFSPFLLVTLSVIEFSVTDDVKFPKHNSPLVLFLNSVFVVNWYSNDVEMVKRKHKITTTKKNNNNYC